MSGHRRIALIGIDGAGKTTVAKRLAAELTSTGRRARYFENAGGRPPLNWMARTRGHPDAEAWLGAGRLEAIEQRFRHVLMGLAVRWSRLPGSRVAVLDRWTVCQYAAMRARGRPDEAARQRYRDLPWPDLVVFLDIAPASARERLVVRGRDVDDLEWLEAADAAYRSLPEWPTFTVVDADRPVDDVLADLRALIGSTAGGPAASQGGTRDPER